MEEKKYRGLLLLADGVEETEAVSTHDILTRAGILVDAVSIKDCHRVHTSMGLTIRTDKNLKQIEDFSVYDFLVLPGGKKGVENLEKNRRVQKVIEEFKKKDKLLCAICAAPSIYGNKGYLDGKKFTCFPGFERGKGTKVEGAGAVTDGKLITGRAMYWTIPFAQQIVSYFYGQEGLDRIYHGCYGMDLKK